MTPSKLKFEIEKRNPESKFFTRENMRFAGDTMGNFGVRSATVRTNWDSEGNYTTFDGVSVECWELYRKRTTKKGLGGSFYFSKADFSRVFAAD